MREIRQISGAEEFQIVYVDTLPSEEEPDSPLFKSGLWTATSFPSVYVEKEQRSHFAVETPDKHHFSQGIRVNIHGDQSC